MPASELRTIPLAWPFAIWVLDMVGPFRMAKDGFTHLLVVVDKFTKWTEAKPIRKLDGKTRVNFMRGIIFRFGIPHSIITDNGTNFASEEFKSLCRAQGTRVDFDFIAHLQSNGQVEHANCLILQGLKPRLLTPMERVAGAWVKELPSILWSLRTTPNCSTQPTPFFMVYGVQVIMPSGVLHDSPRVVAYLEAKDEQARQDRLGLFDETQELGLSCLAIYQQNLHCYHSWQVQGHAFSVGGLVCRLDQNPKDKHKLCPPCEGTFIISKVLNNGAYRLYDINKDEESERTWNINLLRPFYTWVSFMFTLIMFYEHLMFQFRVHLNEIKFISSLTVLPYFWLISL